MVWLGQIRKVGEAVSLKHPILQNPNITVVQADLSLRQDDKNCCFAKLRQMRKVGENTRYYRTQISRLFKLIFPYVKMTKIAVLLRSHKLFTPLHTLKSPNFPDGVLPQTFGAISPMMTHCSNQTRRYQVLG